MKYPLFLGGVGGGGGGGGGTLQNMSNKVTQFGFSSIKKSLLTRIILN